MGGVRKKLLKNTHCRGARSISRACEWAYAASQQIQVIYETGRCGCCCSSEIPEMPIVVVYGSGSDSGSESRRNFPPPKNLYFPRIDSIFGQSPEFLKSPPFPLKKLSKNHIF